MYIYMYIYIHIYIYMSRTMKIGLLICCLICRPRLICVVLTDPLKQI